jgi:hypothetical protein
MDLKERLRETMKIGELNGFEFFLPTSGGKAGKGCNRTSTIQIRKHGTFILKQFRFIVSDAGSRAKAMAKAKRYAMDH